MDTCVRKQIRDTIEKFSNIIYCRNINKIHKAQTRFFRYSRLAMTTIQFTGASTPEPLVEVSNSRLEELSDEESS